jgi:hypothetical protein
MTNRNRLLLYSALTWILAGLLVIPVPTAAQDANDDTALPIQRLHIQVMPEFDDPRVLVIVQGKLALSDEALPRDVTFRVPRGAQINQMASLDMVNGLTQAHPYHTQPDPAHETWTLVTYTVENAHFFYEYYYNPLDEALEKTFTFTLQPFNTVEDVQIEVQQPHRATDFEIDREPTAIRRDDALGFTYYRFNLGAMAQGEATTLRVRYTKRDPNPSLSQEELMAMQMEMGNPSQEEGPTAPPAAMTTPMRTSVSPLLLGVLVLGIVGGLLWYGRRTPRNPSVSQTAKPAGYCPQCGVALKPGARFCHGCGAPQTRTSVPST